MPDGADVVAALVWAHVHLQGVDVIILSVPLNALPPMKELLAGVPEEVTIIDTSNYYPFRDTRIEAIEAGQVESLWVVEQLQQFALE